MRRSLTLVAGLCLLACFAPTAEAAKRVVPAEFMGVMLDLGAEKDPPAVIDAQMASMARSGVESVRTTFSWPEIQSVEDGPFDFSATDLLVESAARHGLGVLPVMIYSPVWARVIPEGGISSPPRTKPYLAFLRASIRRYGSRGSFWRERPGVPRRPLRYWQIWNEPHFFGFWSAPKGSGFEWPRGYANLLKLSNRTIHRTDRRARTVTGGMFGAAWEHLRRLYKAGGRGTFDVAAVHVYSRLEKNVLATVRRVNRQMKRSRDRGNRVWITEFSYPAARGKVKPIGSQAQETPRSMAKKLYRTYLLLGRNRKREKLDRAYWYTWSSSYQPQPPTVFNYSGLLSRPDAFNYRPQPALSSFRRIAERLEGCRKNDRGRCR